VGASHTHGYFALRDCGPGESERDDGRDGFEADIPMNTEVLQPGAALAGYRIERHVAHGGMGEVYEATQLSLDRRVALKLIARRLGTDERFRERFRREARSAAAIDHTNILPVYETGETADGRLFLAMRFVEGPDLSSLLREQGPLDPAQTVAILRQIGDALDAAHQRGLIHRDVKPANVMLEAGEEGWHAYLTDLGLAKPNDDRSENTASGEILGTVDYMAPEQIEGGVVDGRSDVYAFGCLLYRCLTGRVPFPREAPSATLMAHMNAPVPRPSALVPGLPEAFDTVVLRAMEKDPEHRAKSAGALMRWLAAQVETVSGAEPAAAELPWASDRLARPRLTWRRVAAHTTVYAIVWTVAFLVGRTI
jgi:serine/threonine protein kinase